MSEKAIHEFDELASHDIAEFEASLILRGITSGIMTDDDKDKAALLVRLSRGITFRKLRNQMLGALDRDLIPA